MAEKKVKSLKYFEGVGRRKASTARVRIYKGEANCIVNDRDIEKYFLIDKELANAQYPLLKLGLNKDYYFTAVTKGGGIAGQSDSVKLGLARAIVKMDESFKSELKKDGLMTRDARIVERKKPGFRKARKKPQFSKR